MTQVAERLSPLAAYEELMRFAKLRGESALRLAMHAAVPQGIQSELLHLLRRNFVPEAGDDPTLEADILFSPLCEELGRGYFKFDPHVRALLLENLDANYADEPESRVGKVADFLLAYVDHYDRLASGSQDQLWRDYLEMQRWVAFAFADPSAAAQQLAEALESASSMSDFVARIQLGGLASALAAPLSGFPRLLNYAAGVQALELGDRERAGEFFDTLRDDELKIGNTTLRSTGQILSEWHARHPEYVAALGETKEVGDSRRIEHPIRALRSGVESERIRAAETLRNSVSDDAVNALIDGLGDSVAEVRRACAVALADIQTEAALIGLAPAIADPDRKVGHTAAEALRSLGKQTALILGESDRSGVKFFIQGALLRWNYLPVDMRRTVGTRERLIEIAQDVNFVIVDVNDASIDLSYLESFLQRYIPVQLIMWAQSQQVALLTRLQRYPSLMKIVTYDDANELDGLFEKLVLPSIQSWFGKRSQRVHKSYLATSNFLHDVFISYAHADNAPRFQMPPDLSGLIDALAKGLSIRLAELIGEEPNIFLDTHLSVPQDFSVRTGEVINNSAVYVVVISDAYLKSAWCMSELETIMMAERSADLSQRAGRRLFLVSMRPFVPEQLPPFLRALSPYELLEGGLSRPEFQLETATFHEMLNRLAFDISKVLQALRTTPSAQVNPSIKTVYLAETTRELRDERDRLKRTLETEGYRVLPDRPLPITAAKFKRAVKDYLRISHISIHLLGQKYGSYPDGGNRSIPELQFLFAGERMSSDWMSSDPMFSDRMTEDRMSSDRMTEDRMTEDRISDPTFSRIVWMPSGARPESARQRRLFDIAVAEQKQVDVLRTSLADLEESLLDRLERLEGSSQTADEAANAQEPVDEEPEIKQTAPERWPVRTGTDQDVSKVNLRPVATTVQALIDQKRPLDMPSMSGVESKYQSRRAEPVETTVWSVNATIRVFKRNVSESYLVILEGPDGVTMRAEVPDPLKTSDSPWHKSFAKVRRRLREKLPFRRSFSYIEPNLNVRVTGVGFFSGFHGQRDAAPNGIELQPILDIEWLPDSITEPKKTSKRSALSKKFPEPFRVRDKEKPVVVGGQWGSKKSRSVTKKAKASSKAAKPSTKKKAAVKKGLKKR